MDDDTTKMDRHRLSGDLEMQDQKHERASSLSGRDADSKNAQLDRGPLETAAESSLTSSEDSIQHNTQSKQSQYNKSLLQKLSSAVTYVPPRCRYDPDHPFEFSMSLNVLFAFAGCFTVANLYYTHPILNLFARDFHVTDLQSSYIPTLAQAGYAFGILTLNPMGDLLKRRPFVLLLVWFTATLWIGLCVTESFAGFGAITFIVGVTTVTPQIMLPLVGDMAPAHRRSSAISIVTSGMGFGMLLARLLSGVVANYISWRYVYWMSFALQYIILTLLYLYMPDYPSTNPEGSFFRKYPRFAIDITKMLINEPVLVQACIVGFLISTAFTNYWTTLTFLLDGPPYNYSTLFIGLFTLIGIAGMALGPVYARTVMDKHTPILSTMFGNILVLFGVTVGAYTGSFTVAGPILQAIFVDVGLNISQVANRTGIYAVAPKARNRVNTAYMLSVFCGQLVGTAVGNDLYARGGWIASGSASVGFVSLSILVTLARGPHEPGWVGWSGGWRSKSKEERQGHQQEEPQAAESDAIRREPGENVEPREHDAQNERMTTEVMINEK